MAITAISTDWGAALPIQRMTCTDSFDTITTNGYVTGQAANIIAVNNGAFTFNDGDMFEIAYVGGPGFFTYNASTDCFNTLPNSGNVSNTLSAGFIYVGNASNVATGVEMTGVIAMSDTGVTSFASGAVNTAAIANNAVTSDKIAANTIQHVTVPLTLGDFTGSYANPFELIAAPGANLKIVINEMNVFLTYGGTVFAAGGAIAAQYTNTANGLGTLATSTISAASLISQTTTGSVLVEGAQAWAAETAVANQGIYLSNQSAAFTGGTDSSFVIDLWYSVIPA
jgi:hypothetical protein